MCTEKSTDIREKAKLTPASVPSAASCVFSVGVGVDLTVYKLPKLPPVTTRDMLETDWKKKYLNLMFNLFKFQNTSDFMWACSHTHLAGCGALNQLNITLQEMMSLIEIPEMRAKSNTALELERKWRDVWKKLTHDKQDERAEIFKDECDKFFIKEILPPYKKLILKLVEFQASEEFGTVYSANPVILKKLTKALENMQQRLAVFEDQNKIVESHERCPNCHKHVNYSRHTGEQKSSSSCWTGT